MDPNQSHQTGTTPPGFPQIGSTIGHYKLLSKLGEGGMGIVFLAQREDDVQLQVALKVLHRVDENFQALFGKERQILADLNHPYIARYIDSGHTQQGLPYLIMEYVQGSPITSFCDIGQLDINSRYSIIRQGL